MKSSFDFVINVNSDTYRTAYAKINENEVKNNNIILFRFQNQLYIMITIFIFLKRLTSQEIICYIHV